MKKLSSLSLMLSVALCLQAKTDNKKAADPIVMTINGTPVSRAEFEYFYTKNSQQELAEEKTFEEYVDLFVNYKLKVTEALTRGVDTTAAYQSELAGYRAQLAEPYLEAKGWQDSLVEEALERQKWEVKASHILIQVGEKDNPQKGVDAKARILELQHQVENGASFDSLARAFSEDPSAKQNAGDLGYFSSLQMVYPFEEAAFTTPVGKTSVCRSSFGWHLIKVFDVRRSKGEVRVAHIMKELPRGAAPEVKAQLKNSIDSVYQQLKEGKDFAALAQAYSDDKYTASKGGEYPWLNSNARFPQEWLNVAFGLANPGDYSEPFATDYGWHIVRLIEKRAEPVFDESTRARLREQLSQDPDRKAKGEKKALAVWAKEYGMTINPKVQASIVKLLSDTTLTFPAFSQWAAAQKKPLLTIARQTYSASDFVSWLEPKYSEALRTMDLDEALQAWSNIRLREYEDSHLSDKYEDFRNLYREYHDGILLFDVASGEVWDKAQKDTVGLRQYFEEHRQQYAWGSPRFKGAFIECADSANLVARLKEIYNSNDYLKAAEIVRSTVLTDSVLTPNPKKPLFHIVNGVYNPGDNETVDVQQLGLTRDIHPRPSMPVQMTYGRVLPYGPESYEDVRGAVINDYQALLEKNWVEQLRAKYKVELNQKELDSVKAAHPVPAVAKKE